MDWFYVIAFDVPIIALFFVVVVLSKRINDCEIRMMKIVDIMINLSEYNDLVVKNQKLLHELYKVNKCES